MTDDGLFIPDWVLDVKEVESSQVGAGMTIHPSSSLPCDMTAALPLHLPPH